jgi:hypothetical protein
LQNQGEQLSGRAPKEVVGEGIGEAGGFQVDLHDEGVPFLGDGRDVAGRSTSLLDNTAPGCIGQNPGAAKVIYDDFGTWFNRLPSMSSALSTKSASVTASSRSNMAS